MKLAAMLMGLIMLASTPNFGQNLDPADVRIRLDEAIPIALKTASKEFPDLDKYILYSVIPRVLKGDRRGLHWQFEWQEAAFPHYKLLVVRVYMKDGSLFTERLEKGELQKERDTYVKP